MKEELFFARIPDPEHPDMIPFCFPIPHSVSKFWRIPLPRVAVKSRMPLRDFAFSRIPHSNLVEMPYSENSLPDTGHSIESKWSAEFKWFYRTQSLWSLDSMSLQSVIVRWRTLLPRYKSRIPNSLKCLWLFLRSEYSKKFAACLFDPHSFPTILN